MAARQAGCWSFEERKGSGALHPVITANWNARKLWTLPLGGGVGKQFTIGKQPMNAKLQVEYNVVRPDNAPEWAVKFTWQLLFPK